MKRAIDSMVSDDRIILPVVWVGSLCLILFIAPRYGHEPPLIETLYYSVYNMAIAYGVAYLLYDRLIRKSRYALFFGVSLAAVIALSVFDEIVIDTNVFGGPISAEGVYYAVIEAGAAILAVLALRLFWLSHEERARNATLAKDKAEAELNSLKAQIHPHSLFNVLNNIYSHAVRGSDLTATLILRLSELLRFQVYETDDDCIPLENEISYLETYVELQRIMMDCKGRVDFTVSGDAGEKFIAPFLFMPLVENCFKHSLESLEKEIEISIQIRIKAARINLECANNFTPCGDKKSGIGLANLTRRLELLFSDDFTLDKRVEGDKYYASLEVPLSS